MDRMQNLKGKAAIVTGSSRGIGAEVAKWLAEAGASVVINYSSNPNAADEVVKSIGNLGGTSISVKADVSKPVEITRLFDEAISVFKKVDILINNAGIMIFKTIADTTEEEFDRAFRINVKGVFFAMKEAAARMEDNGRIVNFSSSVTRLMMPSYGVYSATKSAVEQLTRVFAKEIGPRGITVNSILPGPTDTELFRQDKTDADIKRVVSMAPLGRIGQPEDIAKVVLFLVSDEAAWVSGQSIGANGGFA
jgi:3-oxoacyl-[acyl-carrier protein] reductase